MREIQRAQQAARTHLKHVENDVEFHDGLAANVMVHARHVDRIQHRQRENQLGNTAAQTTDDWSEVKAATNHDSSEQVAFLPRSELNAARIIVKQSAR